MKKGIHPKETLTKFVCSCGNVIEAYSTKGTDTYPIEVCYECHPFYTGKQTMAARKGNVDKFNKKYGFTSKEA